MKKYNLLAIAQFVLSLLFIVSCSTESTHPAQEKKTKTYSMSTQREFEEIEKGEIRSGSTYRQSRPALKPSAPIREVTKELPKETRKAPTAPLKSQSTELVPTRELSAKNQERLQEINQNLAFYCMKHRKDSSYTSEENCLKFTKMVLNECEKKHKLINTVMVNCIKERLKKRR